MATRRAGGEDRRRRVHDACSDDVHASTPDPGLPAGWVDQEVTFDGGRPDHPRHLPARRGDHPTTRRAADRRERARPTATATRRSLGELAAAGRRGRSPHDGVATLRYDKLFSGDDRRGLVFASDPWKAGVERLPDRGAGRPRLARRPSRAADPGRLSASSATARARLYALLLAADPKAGAPRRSCTASPGGAAEPPVPRRGRRAAARPDRRCGAGRDDLRPLAAAQAGGPDRPGDRRGAGRTGAGAAAVLPGQPVQPGRGSLPA